MSIDESLAASRRTSETRCWSDAVERKLILMLYFPPEALLQPAAALANDPDGSGNTYQLSVTGPLPEPPQPANSTHGCDRSGDRRQAPQPSTKDPLQVSSLPL